jgi:hypothetical protein
MKKTSTVIIIIFFSLFIFYLSIGIYLSHFRGFLPGDALARLVNAWLTIRGTEAKLASIGFVYPPIPTLLIIPFAAIPFLVKTWLAVVLVSSISMALSAVMVYLIAEKFDVPGLWKLLIVLLYATNPLIIVFGANGMSEAVLLAVLLLGLYWLIVFWKDDSNMSIVLSAGFFGVLPLIRYDAVLISFVAAFVILAQSWVKQYSSNRQEFMNLLEGRLLAYGSLAIYPLFLWMIINWQIMGSPIYFINNPKSALNVAEYQLMEQGINTLFIPAMSLAFNLWIQVFPLNLILTIISFIFGSARRNNLLIGLGIMSLVSPITLGILVSQSLSVPLLRYFINNIPISVVMIFLLWFEFNSLLFFQNKDKTVFRLGTFFGVLILFMGSNIFTGYALSNSPYQTNENPMWLGIVSTNPIPYTHLKQPGEGLKIGYTISDIIPEGKKVLIDTYAGGYAIILASGTPEMFFYFTDPNYDLAIQKPWMYADYLLIPSPETEGKYSEINRLHPNLHSGNVDWVELVDELPETLYDWKLYKIIPK